MMNGIYVPLCCCLVLLFLQQAYGAPEVELVENSVKRVGVRIQPRIRRGFERRTKIPLPLPVDKERTPVFEGITIAPSASS